MDATVRLMRKVELTSVLSWAKEMGWEPGTFDTDAFWAADNEGFYVAEVEDEEDESQRLVGCISCVAYGENYGFIGLYIVKEAYRGHGIGRGLFKVAMERLAGRNVGLDAVEHQKSNYERSGFKAYHKTIRFQLSVSAVQSNGCKDFETRLEQSTLISVVNHCNIVRLGSDCSALLSKCDRWVFPEKREEFLKEWLRIPRSATFGYLRDDEEEVSGYITVRKSANGWSIGPLAADEKSVASSLLEAAIDYVKCESSPEDCDGGDKVRIVLGVPENNAEALTMASDYGMKELFPTLRMYTREIPPTVEPNRTFCITTFTLG